MLQRCTNGHPEETEQPMWSWYGGRAQAVQQLVHEHRTLDGIGVALVELEEEQRCWLDGPCSATMLSEGTLQRQRLR